MQYKNLGRSGLKVSQLSYGAWVSFGNQLDVKEAKSLLQTCRDHGVNFFDNAEVYANGRAEEIMGQAIRELGWKRSDIVISTKIFWGGPGPNDKGLSRKHIIEGTKNLGRSSLKVSQLFYGSWVSFGNQLDVKEAKSLLQTCRDHGVNFFDNTEVYTNGRAEEIMGQAIRELGWKWSDIVVFSKIFWGEPGPNDKGLSRKHIIGGTKASLKRLDMDYVDLIYCHRPDSGTPIEETVRAMNYVIEKGWAFYWGTSEWSAQQITEAWGVAQRLGLVGPVVEQPEYNMLSRHKVETEYLPLYENYGIGLTTWSPLASGVLTGKYSAGNIPADSRFALENYKNLASRSLVDDTLKKVEGLKPIAAELGVPLAQLAIAWCAANPNVSSVITGATKEAQIKENMKAIEVIPLLTPAVMERIEAVIQSKPKRPDSYR